MRTFLKKNSLTSKVIYKVTFMNMNMNECLKSYFPKDAHFSSHKLKYRCRSQNITSIFKTFVFHSFA